MKIKILSDEQILHPAEFDQGPRITRQQIIEIEGGGEGKKFRVDFWTVNGVIHHIDLVQQ